MLDRGYPNSVAAGSIAAEGTPGILISPSVTLIVYGIATETSIGRLFMVGIAPGIMLTVMFMTRVIINVFLLVSGMFLPPIAVIVMATPMLFPIITQAGSDVCWLATILTINMEVGLITPPVGLYPFVIDTIAPRIPKRDILLGGFAFCYRDVHCYVYPLFISGNCHLVAEPNEGSFLNADNFIFQ
jgi:TRAP-type C4-dicarboxylate transport system permease large subunit